MKFKVGDKVNYHALAGGSVTSTGHEITNLQPMPNNYGCDVAWITGKSGCVDVGHLSPAPVGIAIVNACGA